MLPSVNVRRKRSKSKLSCDFTDSPYIRIVTRTPKVKSNTLFNPTPLVTSTKCLFVNKFTDTNKHKEFQKFSQSTDQIQKITSEDFEGILNDRLEKFKAGDSDFINELELIESFYDEILTLTKPYERILNLLRIKLKESYYQMAKEDLEKKIERVKKENSSLLLKINNLSDINSELFDEKKKLQESNDEYLRMFKHNPEVLINYENIVNQMLGQCETINLQKKELKRLKKVEETHLKLLDDLRKYKHLDSSYSDDSPKNNKIIL